MHGFSWHNSGILPLFTIRMPGFLSDSQAILSNT